MLMSVISTEFIDKGAADAQILITIVTWIIEEKMEFLHDLSTSKDNFHKE